MPKYPGGEALQYEPDKIVWLSLTERRLTSQQPPEVLIRKWFQAGVEAEALAHVGCYRGQCKRCAAERMVAWFKACYHDSLSWQKRVREAN